MIFERYDREGLGFFFFFKPCLRDKVNDILQQKSHNLFHILKKKCKIQDT